MISSSSSSTRDQSSTRPSSTLIISFIAFVLVTVYHISNNITFATKYEEGDINTDIEVKQHKPVKPTSGFHSTQSNADGVINPNTINYTNTSASATTTTGSGASFNDEIPTYDDDDHDDDESYHQPCEFQKPYSSAPLPVILISLGRSGSSVTWDTLSTMLGSTTKAYEITGGNRTKAINFFAELEDGNWPIRKSCKIQKYNVQIYEHPVITGFQWKPYRPTLNHTMGIAGLKALASFNEPPIKVIFLARDPLDRLISNLKHKGYQHSTDVPAHCAIDDEECIKRHKEHSKGTTLPTGSELIRSMKSGMNIDKLCTQTLDMYGINYIIVKYEKLYNDEEDVSEWIRIFDYLGRSPKNVKDYKNNLTMKDVVDAFAMAPTSSKKHEDTIANYEEVKKTLDDAGMGFLLH